MKNKHKELEISIINSNKIKLPSHITEEDTTSNK